MFMPIGDHPNPRGVPVVNWLLLGLNIGVYLLITLPLSMQLPDLHDPATLQYLETMSRALGIPARTLLSSSTAYDIFMFSYGFRPSDPSLLTLLSAMFLHAGLLHLVGNMLFLWIYGDNVEHRLGRNGYLLAYLLTGVAATLGHSFLAPGSPLPMVGASGAISGVLGFYFLWFPRNQVKVLVVLFPFLVDVIRLPARIVLGFYLIVDNLLPMILSNSSGGVAHGAHLGGFIAGLLFAFALGEQKITRAKKSFTLPPDARENSLETVLRAAHREDWETAGRALLSLPRPIARQVPPRLRLDIAHWLDRNAPPEVATVAFRRYIADHPRGPDLAEAHLGLGLLLLRQGEPATAYQYLLTALELNPSPEIEHLAREGIAAIKMWQRQRRKLR